MKMLSKLLLTLTFVCTLSACNTIQGAGKDIQQGGQAISNAAS
jgi:predicted small secreted protein